MVDIAIRDLVRYGVETGLVPIEDSIYVRNRVLETMQLVSYEEPDTPWLPWPLEEILCVLLDDAAARGIIEDDIIHRDLMDAKLMGCLTPPPSLTQAAFWALYEDNPQAATDWYYEFCQDTDYIRRYRIIKDEKWVTKTEYGEIDITINLSKPEKDPKAIAAAKSAPQSGYPKCLLCRENEGYAGHTNHPARQNHRVIPITVAGQPWFFQYSPYVYYNEHCIAFNSEHIPMKIDWIAFQKMFDFVKLFPHYFIGSNADLPIVGGSILSHDHFQGGHYTFAMEKAPVETWYEVHQFEDVETGIVRWPMSVIRLRHKDEKRLIALADKILGLWRGYTDPAAVIFAETDGEPHNTITPIARRRNGKYELDLVLRNNLTTADCPLGLYHPHAEKHHIKKENIGLIEVMGLAVLPARLKTELALLRTAILSGADLRADERTAKHADWAEEFVARRGPVSPETLPDIIREEVGRVFAQVLEDAGVYKRTTEGRAAFERFLTACGAKRQERKICH